MNIPATVKIPPFIQANPVFMLAAMFAHEQHEKVGQKREASGEPYIVHVQYVEPKCMAAEIH